MSRVDEDIDQKHLQRKNEVELAEHGMSSVARNLEVELRLDNVRSGMKDREAHSLLEDERVC
jgi:hypothetical protein